MIRELIQYLRVAEDLSYHNNIYLGTPIYNTVLHSLVEAKEVSASPCILFFCCQFVRCGYSALFLLQIIFLVDMQSYLAIGLFKNMKSSGFMPDAATYNIMIDCCSTIRCYTSACALVSMMLRVGFYPQTATYTALIKVFELFSGPVLSKFISIP